MSNNLAATIPCPTCHEAQLNRDLLKVHLIQEHGRTVEQAEKEACPLGGLFSDLSDVFAGGIGKFGRGIL